MMRKFIFCLVAALTCICMRAEDHYVPHVSVGFHGGATLSKVSFSPSVHQGWAQGYTGGIAIRYAEERLVGLMAEVNFIQRGWSENYDPSPDEKSSLRYTRTINYVSVPLMTHIYFGPKRCKCFFNLGPEFSYYLSESTASNFDYTNPTSAPEWPSLNRMTWQLTEPVKNKFDYGICAGVGCEYYLSPRNSVYVEARFYYGLGNIYPATKADTFGASRNMSLAATIGYNFRVK